MADGSVTTGSGVSYVDLTNNQTIDGFKNFTKDIKIKDLDLGHGGFNEISNVAFGNNALVSNQSGTYNIAFGRDAARNNNSGSNNVVIGSGANYYNESSSDIIAIGTGALHAEKGTGNVALGSWAGHRGGIADNLTNSVFLGKNSSAGGGSVDNSVALGYGASVDANNTIQLGNGSITDVKTSGKVTASGFKTPSGTSSQYLMADGSVTTGSSGVPYNGATQAVDLGNYNLSVYNVTIGIGSGGQQTNTALGNTALANNTNGYYNTATGGNALRYNTSGVQNTSNGFESLFNNQTGSDNTAFGFRGLINNTNGNYNTAVGYESLGSNSSGEKNTAIGKWALSQNTGGSNNTAIGYDANVYSGSGNFNNSTAIGFESRITASNMVSLGNGSITRVETSGTLYSNGAALTSDKRLKTNIVPISNAIETIMKLNPVHYDKKNTINSKEYAKAENGFIAQEIQKILPFIVKEGTDADKLLSVDYNSIIPVLAKAIQEQQKEIEELKELVKQLINKK